MTAKFTLPFGILSLTILSIATAPGQAQSMDDLQPSVSTSHTGGHRAGDLPILSQDSPPMSAKQKQSIMHSNFVKSKSDAAELASLAKELREELNKPNVNVASLEIVSRAEKIEKLAKRIRDETKGF